MLHHAEVALHHMFGDKLYWQCRRSMRFNEELRSIAADFRQQFLNSSDDLDGTILPNRWQDEKVIFLTLCEYLSSYNFSLTETL